MKYVELRAAHATFIIKSRWGFFYKIVEAFDASTKQRFDSYYKGRLPLWLLKQAFPGKTRKFTEAEYFIKKL